MKISVDCKEDCECDEKCDNSECLNGKKEETEQEDKETQEQENQKQENTEQPIPAPTGQAINLIQIKIKPDFNQMMIGISVILVLLIVFLGAVMLRIQRK